MRLSVFGEDFGPTMRGLAAMQGLLALIWVLHWWSSLGTVDRWQAYGVMCWWLPLNYAAFDLYLLVREGLNRRRGRPAFARISGAADSFLCLSPIVMLATAPLLGAAGSRLHEACGL